MSKAWYAENAFDQGFMKEAAALMISADISRRL